MTDIQPKRSGLTVRMVSEMTGFEPTEIALVSRTVAVGADLQELAVFLHSCKQLGLDPLLRQAYWIRRKGKGALQVGIDGFRAIAESSGVYAGAEPIEFRGQLEWTYKDRKVIVPELARSIVWKVVAGHKSPFTGEAYWQEFVPSGESEAFMWSRMPRHMLGKCAEAQALRRAFPAQLGGLQMAEDSDDVDPEPVVKRSQKDLAAQHAAIFDDAYDLPEATDKTDKALPAQDTTDDPYEELPNDD